MDGNIPISFALCAERIDMFKYLLKHQLDAVSIVVDGSTVKEVAYQGTDSNRESLIEEIMEMVSLVNTDLDEVSDSTPVYETSVLMDEFHSTSVRNCIFIVRKDGKLATRVVFEITDDMPCISSVTHATAHYALAFFAEAVISERDAEVIGVQFVKGAGFDPVPLNDGNFCYYKPDYS